jgi:hypothetical protein
VITPGLLITIGLDGEVRASEVACSDEERQSTAKLMSVVEPELKRIRATIRDSLVESE